MHFLKTISFLIFISLWLVATTHAADPYPNKPVKVIVPYPPGGTTDILARVFSQKMSEAWGQSVIVENRAGAGGGVGASIVARSASDGYTIMMGTIGSQTVNPIFAKDIQYDPERDFAPITLLATLPHILVVNPAFPVGDLKALIAYARANPGKVTYASDGNGSVSHLTGELFRKSADINIVHVPYRGSTPALTDLIAGQVLIKFDYAPASMPYVRAGKLRAIGVTGLERSKHLPDLPTLDEAGLPKFNVLTWWGFYAPKGTSSEIIRKIRDTVAKSINAPDVVARNLEVDLVASTPAELAKFQHNDIEHWKRTVQDMNIKAE